MCNRGNDKKVQCYKPISLFYTCSTHYTRESGIDNNERHYSV